MHWKTNPYPVYGDGKNIRDWVYVEEHCRGIDAVLTRGTPGQVYNIGGNNEWQNIDIVELVCRKLDERQPASRPYRELITFVTDRPGHDRRYAIDSGKIQQQLGWSPQHDFQTGLEKALDWYLDNPTWCQRVRSGDYQNYYKQQYG